MQTANILAALAQLLKAMSDLKACHCISHKYPL